MVTTARLRLLLVFALSLFTYNASVWAETAEEKVARLDAELVKVRSDLSAAQTSLGEQSQEILRQQNEIEYSDPDTKKLKDEVVVLEKQLIEKRKELQLRMKLNPKLKELDAKRTELFRNLESLRATEQAIVNELKAVGVEGAVQP